MSRPRGSRLLEGHSPKLGRCVRLFDHLAFAQWIRLEADPTTLTFCERPARVDPQPQSCLIDFWVRRPGGQAMLLLESRYDLAVRDVDGVSVEIVPLAELAAARMWISNWSRMLPVINAVRSLLPKSLSKSILGRVHGPETLACVERDLAIGDPAILRGAIFELLRTGQLRAPSLHFQPLDLHLMLEPAT
ncbi:MAG: hypothetical protein M3082_00695 [Candidatus Dormibacteraeota bacterium]|nr:hypothetical protein [Candidatus Dormibacteraeota bacterium]